MFEREWRLFSEVPRWATIRSRGQRLAEHSFFVALYADQIAQLIGWQGNYGDLLRHAMLHDADELITGDIPGTWKRKVYNETDRQTYAALAYDQLRCWFPWLNPDQLLCWFPWLNPDTGANVEVRAIVRCADMLDSCLFAAIEQRHGNPDFSAVARTSWDQMRVAIDALPFDKEKRDELERAVTKAIGDHRHEPPRFVS